jgi:hypothetical protein
LQVIALTGLINLGDVCASVEAAADIADRVRKVAAA